MAYKKKIGSWQDLWLGGGNWKPRRKTRRTQGAIPGGMREPNFWASTKPMSTQALEHGPGRTAAPPWVQNMIDARSQSRTGSIPFDANKYRVDANKYRAPDATGGAPSDLFPTGGMLWDGLGDEPQMTQDQIDAGYQFGAPEDQQRMSLLDRAGDFISRKWEGRDKTPMDSPVNRGLIQFGLSAMNPDTYYNKEGFGIGALGAFSKAGQAGLAEHDKVREILGKQKERATKERLAEIEERKLMQGEKDPTSVAEWKQALEEGDPDAVIGYGHWNKKMAGLKSGMYSPARKTAQYINEKMAGSLPEKHQGALDMIGSLESTMEARKILREGNILTGPGAATMTSIGVLLMNMGIIAPESDTAKTLANTQTYFSAMAKLTAENIKAFGAGTGLSDRDLEFAQMMSGDDQAQSLASIKKLINLNELYMRNRLQQYSAFAQKIKKGPSGQYIMFDLGLPDYGGPSAELNQFLRRESRTPDGTSYIRGGGPKPDPLGMR